MTAPLSDRAAYVTALGDDALVSAQRMGEWIASSPQIEEDVALGNIALDLLGQARSLLSYAGSLEDPARTEDDLAYFRDEREFRNVQLVERGWGRERRDFGVAMVRLLILSAYQYALYSALTASTDETLAAVAAKAVKEVDYHRDHAVQWTLRLAHGTDESRRRMTIAIADTWPYIDELFEDDGLTERLAADGVAVLPSTLRDRFDEVIAAVLAEAELEPPTGRTAFIAAGRGRSGSHTEHLGPLLAEMQVLARQHPGASW